MLYFNADLHADRIAKLKAKEIEINLNYLFTLGYEGAKKLAEIVEDLQAKKVKVSLTNASPKVLKVLQEDEVCKGVLT